MTKRVFLLPLVAIAVAACGGPGQSAGGSIHPAGWGKPAPASVQHTFSAVPTATMYDSITVSTVPAHPFAQAGYTAGFWPTYLPLRKAWPLAHTISIAIQTRYHAACLDVEPGDADPSQVAGWVRADEAAGFKRPCVYSSFWEYVNQVRPDLARAGIARSSVYEWDADYTGVAHIDAGFDATQYTDKCLGRNLDCSVVLLPFLSIAQPPYVPPAPKPKPAPKPVPKPKPGPSYNENFTGGFQRGFVVGFDRRHRRAIPAPTFAATNSSAFNVGFHAGFQEGWSR